MFRSCRSAKRRCTARRRELLLRFTLALVLLVCPAAHGRGERARPRIDAGEVRAHAERPRSEWLQPDPLRPESPPSGVVLVLHGLNLQPEKMNDIARALTERGMLVLMGSLAGHEGDGEPLVTVTPEMWMSECLELYGAALDASERFGTPLYFAGYSLGCLLVLDLMERCERVRFERLLLFAPVVTPRPIAYAVRLLGKNRVVPSKTPEGYRVHDGVPASAYRSLLDVVDHLKDSGYRRANQEALVFIDKKDELVDYRALRELQRTRLNRWRIVTVDTEGSTLEVSYHHLIVDERSVGTEEWRRITGEAAAFLTSQPAGP